MNKELLIVFIVLNIVNVVIQTVKSLATVKCGKTVAAIVNAVAYGLYTVVVVYTVCDLPLWLKVVVVGVANLIGVYVVKYFEEKGLSKKADYLFTCSELAGISVFGEKAVKEKRTIFS